FRRSKGACTVYLCTAFLFWSTCPPEPSDWTGSGAGTRAPPLARRAGAGRQVDYSAEAIARQLRELRDDRGALEALTVQVEQVREQHTWRARALQVAADLSAGGPAR